MSKTSLSLFTLLALVMSACGGSSNNHTTTETTNLESDTSLVYSGVSFKSPESVPIDRLIIKLKPGSNTAKSLGLSSEPITGIQTQQTLSLLQQVNADTYVMALDTRLSLREVIAVLNEIQADPNVDYVEPDWPIYPMLTPTDPGYASQWHLADSVSVAGAANLPDAWDISTGHNSVVVAVMDTGIVTTHPDLSARLVAGYDFIANLTYANDGDGRDANASDPGNWCASPAAVSNWHGTNVAGIIGASANNGLGGAGVDWQARIQPIRVLGKCGGFSSDLIDGIRWAAGLNVSGIADNPTPAKVINLSLGGLGVCGTALQNAINEARAAGSVIIVAAGNEDADAASYTPAACDNVITVAAIGRDGQRASYSNFGATVELSAPGGADGELIYSTSNDGTQGPINNIYTTSQGTSTAAPHVAGLASLMLGGNYNLTSSYLSPAMITTKMLATLRVFPTGTLLDCDTSLCGAGIIDAAAAVAAVTTAPTVDAGVDQTVSNGQAVTLTAIASDDTAGPFIYAWTQTAGNTLTVSGDTTDTLTFTTGVTSETLSFQVEVTDDVGLIGTDTVNVIVSGTNTAPAANATAYTIAEDFVNTATLTGSDADSDPLTFAIVDSPLNGTIDSLDVNTGDYTYTPTLNYVGADSFTFRVNDGLANSTAATVSITLTAVDDPPLAINETLRVTVGSSINGSVRGQDPDGDTLTYALVSSPSSGVLSNFNTATGGFTYAPGAFEGTTQFVFSVEDGNSPPVEGTLTLIAEAAANVGVNASVASPQAPGVAVTFTVLSSVAGNYEYEFWLRGPGTTGAWQRVRSYNSTASWTWNTLQADVGTSTIWIYSRLQGTAVTFASNSVAYIIDDGNQAPTPTSTTLDAQMNTAKLSVLTATDPEGDVLTFAIVSNPANGVITALNGATGAFTYTPTTGFSGTDSFVYSVTDTGANTVNQTLMITVIGTNNLPVAINRLLSAKPAVSVAGFVVGTDADIGDTLTYALVSGPTHGILIGPNSSTGAFSYTADSAYTGSDVFRFSVDDGKTSSTGTVSITVIEQATALVNANLTSPQSAGASIGIQSSVNGLSNPQYEFWLKGPGTSNLWTRMQAYSSDSTWTWTTSGADVGTSTIWIYTRETGASIIYDSTQMEFVIN